MEKIVKKCLELLSAMSSLTRKEEYTDNLIDFTIQFRALVERTLKDQAMTEDLLLCYHQITSCLPYIASSTTVLSYFESRIRFCLEEVLSLLSGTGSREHPESVMTALDAVLDLLEDQPTIPIPSHTEDVIDAVNRLLSQMLFFRTIALPEDQGPISDMCRCILAKKLDLSKCLNDSSQLANLLLSDLRRTALDLENLLSNSLLHLFVDCMVQLQDAPLDSVIEKAKTSSTQEFDLLMERLIQLGVLAIGSTDSLSVKSKLKSAVASLESMDNHLLPMLLVQTQSPASSKNISCPLRRHWTEETTKLGINIHKIIDSKAFCDCLVGWFSERLNRQEDGGEKETATLNGLLKICLVFDQHLCLTGTGDDDDEDIAVSTSKGLGQHRKDLRIMLNECKAVLKYADQVESARVFKRFRLLLHVLQKIRQEVTNDSTEADAISPIVHRSAVSLADYGGESTEYFMSFGISAANCTSRVLYRKRGTAKVSESMIPQAVSRLHSATRRLCPATVFRRGVSSTVEESMHLNITEILEQLDQLPRTFSE